MQNTAADFMKQAQRVHVAVGVIQNAQGEILIAKRADHLHVGGLWEFPGGKVEVGETVLQALQRELHEELAIEITGANPLIRIAHDYPDKQVLLDVWRINDFIGIPAGVQKQPLKWVAVHDLLKYEFPEANQRIISALKLPQEMMITGVFSDVDEFCFRLHRAIDRGVRWVQLRAHQLEEVEYIKLYAAVQNICEKLDVTLIANTSPEIFRGLSQDGLLQDGRVQSGLHLSSKRLMACQQRPVDKKILVGASCHSAAEIAQAEKLQMDYVTLGPVFKTASHPDALPMGIEQFSMLAKQTSVPVFALGGVTNQDLASVQDAGGFGVAGITSCWGDSSAPYLAS